jgi:erythromycin esterase
MRKLVLALSLLASPLLAQTGTIDGFVKNQSGAPVAGMTVAATRFTTDELTDIGPTQLSDAAGHFRFENLEPGKYTVTATSATIASGSAMPVIKAGATEPVTITVGGAARIVSGSVKGGANPRVIAGRPNKDMADLFAVPVKNGRYAIAIAPGELGLRAVADDAISPYADVAKTGDVTHDFELEHVYKTAPAAVVPWLKSAAIPLKSATAGAGFDDLRPLRSIVGSARLVALGEATHGTREFFQIKYRLLEYLVSEMGFDVFAIEASFPDALAVNDYVLNGKGDPAAALAGLGFWTWNTNEVLDMIRWMRAWNEDPKHKRKLRFYGFDSQSPLASIGLLRNYFRSHGNSPVPELNDLARTKFYPRPIAVDRVKSAEAALGNVATRLETMRSADRDWLLARQQIELIRQALHDDVPSDRDRAMAENIAWLLEHEPAGTKMVVWAHNGHVSHETYPFAPAGTMGVHLKKMFGDDLVVFGFGFNRGAFQAMGKGGLTNHVAEPLDAGAFDRTLADAGHPIFIVDLRKAPRDVRRWLDSPLPYRSVGAVYDDSRPGGYVMSIHPSRSFDAVVFVENTTAAIPVKRTPSSASTPPSSAAVNLNLDHGIEGWRLTSASKNAGYTAAAATEGCFSGGCAVMTRSGEINAMGFGALMQTIDATPYRGKKIRFHAKMKSALTDDESSARIWLRVDRAEGKMGFFDNMAKQAPKSLPEWTDMEITGDVADDAVDIAFGTIFIGEGTAWIDEASLEVVP